MDSVERNLRQHVKVLCRDIGCRSILDGSNLGRAKDYIVGQFRDTGLHVLLQEYAAHGVSTANLIATIGNRDPGQPYVLLGAHYDTVPGTPGADDNASGVAVLLETARILSSWSGSSGPVGIMFAAFSTEEPPSFDTDRMGSRVFVGSLSHSGTVVREALVLEMTGYYSSEPGSQKIPAPLKLLGFPDTGSFIAIVGNGRSRKLVREVSSAILDSGCGIPVETLAVPGEGGLLPEARLSDNASFWDAGIPAVMITDTSFFRNPHYHTSTDRPETLDFKNMEKLVTGLVHYLKKTAHDATGTSPP